LPIPEHQAFQVCDVVETDYSGKLTKHIIVERFKTRNCDSGVTYRVVPGVPKSGGADSRLDHNWFKRIGFLRFNADESIIFVPDKTK